MSIADTVLAANLEREIRDDSARQRSISEAYDRANKAAGMLVQMRAIDDKRRMEEAKAGAKQAALMGKVMPESAEGFQQFGDIGYAEGMFEKMKQQEADKKEAIRQRQEREQEMQDMLFEQESKLGLEQEKGKQGRLLQFNRAADDLKRDEQKIKAGWFKRYPPQYINMHGIKRADKNIDASVKRAHKLADEITKLPMNINQVLVDGLESGTVLKMSDLAGNLAANANMIGTDPSLTPEEKIVQINKILTSLETMKGGFKTPPAESSPPPTGPLPNTYSPDDEFSEMTPENTFRKE